MAMVQVDLSEYDMLREAKNKAEKEAEELKETLKGLKDKSRVILTTQYVYPKVNYERLHSALLLLINKYKDRDDFSDFPRYSMQVSINLHAELDSVIRSYIKFDNLPFNPNKCNYSSSQYVGFEDVKARVEEYYKKDIDKAIADCKEEQESYHKLKDSVEEQVREEYTNEIERLKEEQKKVIEYNKKKLSKLEEEKNTEINKLKDKIAELSKSKEDKIAELEATIKEAEAKLRDIAGVKKGFFNKIFG